MSTILFGKLRPVEVIRLKIKFFRIQKFDIKPLEAINEISLSSFFNPHSS
jgi:hypothetical protein